MKVYIALIVPFFDQVALHQDLKFLITHLMCARTSDGT